MSAGCQSSLVSFLDLYLGSPARLMGGTSTTATSSHHVEAYLHLQHTILVVSRFGPNSRLLSLLVFQSTRTIILLSSSSNGSFSCNDLMIPQFGTGSYCSIFLSCVRPRAPFGQMCDAFYAGTTPHTNFQASSRTPLTEQRKLYRNLMPSPTSLPSCLPTYRYYVRYHHSFDADKHRTSPSKPTA